MAIHTILAYQRQHRQALFDLIFDSHYVHLHLDWHRTDDWLEMRDNIILLAYDGDTLMGVLGISAPILDACWLRVLILHDESHQADLVSQLWQAMHIELRNRRVKTVGVLFLESWTRHHFQIMGFAQAEDIITLSRGGNIPNERQPPKTAVSIHLATIDDIGRMLAIDNTAFDPLWQMSQDELRRAKKVAAVCTIALTSENKAVGYQLSTLHNRSGHLARLAVLPTAQNMGVGGALLHDLLWRFLRRETHVITVNTQATNTRSQRLYQRFGFRENGHSMQVWMANL